MIFNKISFGYLFYYVKPQFICIKIAYDSPEANNYSCYIILFSILRSDYRKLHRSILQG